MAKFRKGFYRGWLTEKALIELRKDIKLNSIYIRDYENRFNIDPNQVCDFFDGYVSFLEELMDEKNDFYGSLKNYDTEQNLLNWYRCFDFDNNPFTKFVV